MDLLHCERFTTLIYAQNEKSAKKGQIGAHGLICKIFVKSKKIFMSLRHLKYWQFLKFQMGILEKWPKFLAIFFPDFCSA